jgi:membrane protein
VIVGAGIARALLGGPRDTAPDPPRPGGARSGAATPDTPGAGGRTHAAEGPPRAAPRSLWRRIASGGALVVRAVRGAFKANVTDRAAGLAYYGFLAVPSLLVVALGVTGLVIDPDRVEDLVDKMSAFAPESAVQLIQDVLDQVAGSGGSGVGLIAVGTAFALWSATGAATALMRGLNSAHGRTESRSAVRQRVVALTLVGWLLLAVVVAIGVVALGPVIAARIGDAAGQPGLIEGLWRGLQWPLAIVGLVVALAGIHYAGPDVEQPSRRGVMPGAAFSAVLWLVLSGLFSVYVANFGSYDAAWGSLSAVIVLLTWLWLSALAILLGAHVNAEAARGEAPG